MKITDQKLFIITSTTNCKYGIVANTASDAINIFEDYKHQHDISGRFKKLKEKHFQEFLIK